MTHFKSLGLGCLKASDGKKSLGCDILGRLPKKVHSHNPLRFGNPEAQVTTQYKLAATTQSGHPTTNAQLLQPK